MEQTEEDDSASQKFSVNVAEVMDNIEQFVLQPAAQGYLIKCRITRDRKGMDRGMYPTYYMHLEREDGRKVRGNWIVCPIIYQVMTIKLIVFLFCARYFFLLVESERKVQLATI